MSQRCDTLNSQENSKERQLKSSLRDKWWWVVGDMCVSFTRTVLQRQLQKEEARHRWRQNKPNNQ